MLDLKIDSKRNTISLTIELEGEDKPLVVNVGSYEMIYDNQKHFIKLKNISTSRKWLNVLASELLNDEKFEIPSNIAKIIKVIA